MFYSIVDFFKELPQFLVKAGPVLSNIYGADWENRLEVLTPDFQGMYSYVFNTHSSMFYLSI